MLVCFPRSAPQRHTPTPSPFCPSSSNSKEEPKVGNTEGRTSSNESIAHLCALSTPPPKYPLPVFCNILESLFNPTKRYNQPTHKHPRQVQRHAGQQPAGPGPKEKSRWHNSIGSFVSINPCHFFHELVNRTPLRSNGNQQALRVLNY